MRLAFLLVKEDDSLHRRIEEWVYEYQAKGPERDDEISVIRAYYLSKESEVEQASFIIDKLAKRAEREERNGDLIEYLLLQPNYESLSRALALAEKQGYCRTFLDGGETVQALLSDIHTPYAERLLENFPSASPPKLVNQNDIWFNLSERRILNLLVKEYTNQKIAYELSYSINTVKWYARRIYEKLGVNNRRKAVKRARELDIL
jgi:LuxR family maltose regulon positive regulatory protein